MNQTYKNFLKLSSLYRDQKADLSAVALEYQRTNDPVCYSFVFCRLYAYMITQTDKYFYLTDSDKDSYCMEELKKAMIDFDSTKGAKIQTLFDRYLNNRLRTETEQLSRDKRKVNNNTENYDIAHNKSTYDELSFDCIEVIESLKTLPLSDNELKYCQLIVHNANKINDSDIAKLLGVSSAAIHYIKNSLSKKLNFGF